MTTNLQSKQAGPSKSIGRKLQWAFTQLHVGLYRLTARLTSNDVRKKGILVLTTRGRKSGQERDTPLFYFTDSGRFILIASNGGAAKHPAWWLNIQANPQARIQVRRKTIAVTAATAAGEERERLWSIISANYKNFVQYQSRTERTIPIVILTPTNG